MGSKALSANTREILSSRRFWIFVTIGRKWADCKQLDSLNICYFSTNIVIFLANAMFNHLNSTISSLEMLFLALFMVNYVFYDWHCSLQ